MNAAVATLNSNSKPRLANFVSILLIIALGISLAKLMWLILTPEKVLSNTKSPIVTQLNNSTKQKVNYGKLIAQQHLFGQVKKVSKPVKKPPKEPVAPVVVPKKLNLKLHGIVAYKSRDGFALISSNNGRQKVYAKGDELEDGVTILQILPQKVILDNNGKQEELALPVKKLNDKSRTKTASNTNPRFSPGPGNFPGVNRQPPQMRNQPASPPPDLANFRQQVMANPRKLMDIATPSPAIENGKFIGFRVQPGRDRNLFRQLGFRPNDIITEVNGITLDNANKGAHVLAELSQAADVSVKVKRGNQEILIEHSF